jgi:hypothetical protein
MTDLLSFSGLDDAALFGPERGLSFTIANGQVTGVSETIGAHTANLHIPHGAVFQVGTGQITETLTGHGQTTVITYVTESSNQSLYEVSNVTNTVAAPRTVGEHGATQGFAFTVANGAVTGEQFTVTNGTHSHSAAVPIPADATFTVGTGTVSETVVHGSAVVTTQYVQPAGSSLYAVASVSTSFVDPGSATTLLDVESGERMQFTLGSGTSVTGVQRVDASGAAHAFTPDSHTVFAQLAPGFVEETRTVGSHTTFEVFYSDPGAGGIYTAVAHGSGSAVDITGLEAQLNQLPAASLHLI